MGTYKIGIVEDEVLTADSIARSRFYLKQINGGSESHFEGRAYDGILRV